MQNVIKEFNSYKTSIRAFQLEYDALPGDFEEANDYWSDATNGDGNKEISTNREDFGAWEQLSLAEIIPGTYTGDSGPDHAIIDYVVGTNVPPSKWNSGGTAAWCIYNDYDHQYDLDYTNMLIIATPDTETTVRCRGNPFTPVEARSIDRKVDDGLPAKGKVFAPRSANCTTSHTDYDDYDGTYDISSSVKRCALAFEM